MQNVHLYSDDYTVFNDSEKILQNIQFLLETWSGRVIGHTIVIGGLSLFGLSFFRILQPVFLFLFCYLISKIIKIKIKINTSKLFFFVSILILGLNISINNQLLYWTYSGVLYFWGYIPMLIIIYFISNCIINNKKMNMFQFSVSVFFIIIINFIMESTMIAIYLFILFILIKNKLDKKIDKKLLVLFIIMTLLLAFTFLIPGNISRFKYEQSSLSFLTLFTERMIGYMDFLVFVDGMFPIILLTSLLICIKFFHNKKYRIIIIVTLILNIIFIINFKVYNFLNFHFGNSNYIMYLVTVGYLFLNFYLLFKLRNEIDYSIIYFVFAGLITTVINSFFISYQSERFYFLLIIPLIILELVLYLTSDKNQKILILLIYIWLLNFYIGIICCLLFLLFYKNKKIFKIYLIIVCMLNLFNFFKTMYYYYQNSLIFEYNIETIENAKIEKKDTIYLKKLKYPKYGFHTPDQYDYVMSWYKGYYDIGSINIIYE